MFFDAQQSNKLYLNRFMASSIDFLIEWGGAFLGGYFGAMMAALVIVLHQVHATETQGAIWSGMVLGFLFFGMSISFINRVLIQGISRATIGKKMFDLEIVSTGAPINWNVMVKYWMSATFMGELKVVSILDVSKIATVYAINAHPSVRVESIESDKKAA